MKKHEIIIGFYGFLLSLCATEAQRLEVYTGLVGSMANVKKSDWYQSSGKYINTSQWKLFPAVGYRVWNNIRPGFDMGFGMEYLQLGGKDFYPYKDTVLIKIIVSGDTITNTHIFPKNLLLHTIRVPLFMQWRLNHWLSVEAGYSLAYSFRKNFSFLISSGETDFVSYYKPFTHQISGGVNFNYNNFILRVLYNHSLTGFFDTGKHFDFNFGFDKFYQRVAKTRFLSLTLGYRFKALEF